MTDKEESAFKQALNSPLLTQEEEFAYITAWQNNKDEIALKKLIHPHLRLVVSISKKFKNYGLPQDDLIQEGILGLIHAATPFNCEKGNRFSTYAQWWIRSYMTEYVLRNWSLIRIGTTRNQKALFFNLRRLRNTIDGISGETMTEETIKNIADSLNVTEQDVRQMEIRMSGRDSSLNSSTNDENNEEKTDLIISDDPDPEKTLQQKQLGKIQSEIIQSSLTVLNQREKDIIFLRRLNEPGMTLEQVGKQLNISKERVRQIESKALLKIRNYIIQKGGKDALL